ncbi:MAG: hypothetical protein COX44_00035 [Candidatus Portnoybacteria bacterium CG23_combo_of_CG06-09_8_20_14_all_37_13]|uniref:Type II secretion system protein GspF domain-containing protein n=1 Tax=Candidatus Portnoybacteria bacterium CG23_combo_of_CG06-09_8_20_14_all_37_13 TaxID=1974819 RepID=A0A2G9YE15_9BACT|nr:MAG: hypothetical protein COX44_00035 [Candidatus Portnoybacteria bacterium CG23_combo_of_CG06-09_8_20_14_all_37_13]
MKNIIYKILPISLTEKMLFTKNLAVMAKSGISLPRALEILSAQIKHPYFKKAILASRKSIQEGLSLTDAFSRHARVFNQFYINMIKVGEMSGNLEHVLNILAIQMKKEHQLMTQVRGAMIYPALILLTLIGIGILMFIFVIPKLSQVFTDMQINLPLTTRLFLDLASNIRIYGLYIIFSLTGLILSFYFYVRTLSGKRNLHRLLLYLPFLGKMSQKINITRFAGNLSSLLESGVALVDALKTLQGVLSNSVYQLSIEDISQKVQKGESLTKALSAFPKLYSSLIIQMIEIGEETGTIADSLKQLADFYQSEIDETMKNISSIIEPVLMIIIGVIVGFFAISMISPIYSMLQGI